MSHIGFLGAGSVSKALIKGILVGTSTKASQLRVSAPTSRSLPFFQELGCYTTNDNDELINDKKCSVVFLCCKPYHITNCIEQRRPFFRSGFLSSENLPKRSDGNKLLLISVLAGTSIQSVKKAMCDGKDLEFINFARMMPNTAVSIGEGICPIYRETQDSILDERLLTLLSPLGLCEFVPESSLNVLCGLGGSGIAFIYNIIQAMSDGAVKMGLSRDTATKFAAQTVLGAGKMIIETGKHPVLLRDEVCTPGGTTIHGVHAMEKSNVTSGVIEAVEAATQRANEFDHKI